MGGEGERGRGIWGIMREKVEWEGEWADHGRSGRRDGWWIPGWRGGGGKVGTGRLWETSEWEGEKRWGAGEARERGGRAGGRGGRGHGWPRGGRSREWGGRREEEGGPVSLALPPRRLSKHTPWGAHSRARRRWAAPRGPSPNRVRTSRSPRRSQRRRPPSATHCSTRRAETTRRMRRVLLGLPKAHSE